MNTEIAAELRKIVGEENVAENVCLKDYTSFKVGGNAALMVKPKTAAEIGKIISLLNEFAVPYRILGNGTNVLVSDDGVESAVIHIGKNMSAVNVFENCITAQAGASLSAVAKTAMENSLSGLEFASGIPGNVGGGVIMNAGAYGGELKDVVEAVSFIAPDGKEYAVSGEEMEFAYRSSALMDTGCVVTGVSFVLKKGSKEEISAKMKDFNQRRRDKQPLEYPSAGSTFKRPTGYFAGALIEQANLKGYSCGGAAVSEKHAGFVINKGNATAQDVLNVIRHVQQTVYEKSGVALECEVRIW